MLVDVVVSALVILLVLVVNKDGRIDGEGSRPLMLMEGRARVRVWRMYYCEQRERESVCVRQRAQRLNLNGGPVGRMDKVEVAI